jgi:5'(3')-deoxyribonucleotidase
MKTLIIDMDEVMADTMGGMINWYKNIYTDVVIDYEKCPEGPGLRASLRSTNPWSGHIYLILVFFGICP